MALALNVLTLTGVVVIGFFVYRMSSDLDDLRKDFKGRKGIARGAMPFMSNHDHQGESLGKGYFALWRWEGGEWNQVLGIVPPGADPGSPPSESGKCTGDTRKVWVSC